MLLKFILGSERGLKPCTPSPCAVSVAAVGWVCGFEGQTAVQGKLISRASQVWHVHRRLRTALTTKQSASRCRPNLMVRDSSCLWDQWRAGLVSPSGCCRMGCAVSKAERQCRTRSSTRPAGPAGAQAAPDNNHHALQDWDGQEGKDGCNLIWRCVEAGGAGVRYTLPAVLGSRRHGKGGSFAGVLVIHDVGGA